MSTQSLQIQPPMRHRAWFIGTIGGIIGILTIINTAIWGYYQHRAYPGVVVSRINVGQADESTIDSKLRQATKDYHLGIDIDNKQVSIKPSDVGVVFDWSATAAGATQQGKTAWLPLYGWAMSWRAPVVPMIYRFDQAKLNKLVDSMVQGQLQVATDATITIVNGQPSVVAEKDGIGITSDQVRLALRQSFDRLEPRVTIHKQAVKPLVSNEAAQASLAAFSAKIAENITIQVGSRAFTLDNVARGGLYRAKRTDKNLLTPEVSPEGLDAYIKTVADQLYVAPVNKKINMVNGVVQTTEGGKTGLALDIQALKQSLQQELAQSEQTHRVDGALVAVAYKTVTNNTIALSGKYLEVNLRTQHLWAYQDSVLVYDSPITSGATGAGFPTVQGLFSIQAKQTNRNLNGYAIGYNYNVFVQYWMPFHGNYGLHDASWRSSFGGPDYYYGGSHGCVNLPLATAAWVYNWSVVGTPVWVHS